MKLREQCRKKESLMRERGESLSELRSSLSGYEAKAAELGRTARAAGEALAECRRRARAAGERCLREEAAADLEARLRTLREGRKRKEQIIRELRGRWRILFKLALGT